MMPNADRPRTIDLIPIVVALLLLWGCGSDADRPPPYAEFEGDIVEAHTEQVGTISALLDNARAGSSAYALRSTHHDRAWWVATPTVAGGSVQGVGVWLCTGEQDAPGMCLPASGFATEYTTGNPLRNTPAWSDEMLKPVTALREYAQDQAK